MRSVLDQMRNLCEPMDALMSKMVPWGTYDPAHLERCGNDASAAAYSIPGVASLHMAEDVHGSSPMGGVHPASVTGCARCGRTSTPAGMPVKAAIFVAMTFENLPVPVNPPDWQVNPWHVPVQPAFTPELADDQETRLARGQTRRLMEVAKEWAFFKPHLQMVDDKGAAAEDVRLAMEELGDEPVEQPQTGFDWPHLRGAGKLK